MKQSILLFFKGVFLFSSFSVYSQSPGKINFQSILRNTKGEIVSNKAVSIRMSILSGSANGTSVYSETHVKTTDVSGLISIKLGTGTVVNGIFGDIDWGSGSHFIQLEVDFEGGMNYVVIGSQELISVPYALYANKTDTSVLNLANRLSEKVSVGDTSNMLTNYWTGLNEKLNASDTATMLSTYLQDADTLNMLANYLTALNQKLNKSDTASLSNRISSKVDTTDFPRGTAIGNTMFFNGTSWVNLAPGSPGQSLNISANGIPTWGCIITNTAGAASFTPTLNAYSALTPITISTTGATGIGTATGLPTGVSASWAANTIAISGIPSVTGTFTYTIPLTGGCGSGVNATGTITVNVFTCATNSFSDIDGNTYNTVSIGNQCWMSENLKTSRYRNGDLIPIVTDNTAWGTNLQTAQTGKRSWYNNDSTTYENRYGNLYNWYAVVDSRGLCPTGWHVSSDDEWKTLTGINGVGVVEPGKKLKSTVTNSMQGSGLGWDPGNPGTDNYGFSAFPGGLRSKEGVFNSIRTDAFFWCATQSNPTTAWGRYLWYNNTTVYAHDLGLKEVGASVRCLKD
jgi:uncharacterized protein (TIGR02145 family)